MCWRIHCPEPVTWLMRDASHALSCTKGDRDVEENDVGGQSDHCHPGAWGVSRKGGCAGNGKQRARRRWGAWPLCPRLPSIPTLGTACFLRGGVLNQGPQYWNHSTGLPSVRLPPLPSSVCATSAVLPLPDLGAGTSRGLWLLVQEHGANDVFL